jgi:hypothetical protein
MNVEDAAVHMLRQGERFGLSSDPAKVALGGNSGYQAANLAVLTGVATVILLGYDAREPAHGAQEHWFGAHPRRTPTAVYAKYREAFARSVKAFKEAGVRVINATPGSAIDAFERMALTDALSTC